MIDNNEEESGIKIVVLDTSNEVLLNQLDIIMLENNDLIYEKNENKNEDTIQKKISSIECKIKNYNKEIGNQKYIEIKKNKPLYRDLEFNKKRKYIK